MPPKKSLEDGEKPKDELPPQPLLTSTEIMVVLVLAVLALLAGTVMNSYLPFVSFFGSLLGFVVLKQHLSKKSEGFVLLIGALCCFGAALVVNILCCTSFVRAHEQLIWLSYFAMTCMGTLMVTATKKHFQHGKLSEFARRSSLGAYFWRFSVTSQSATLKPTCDAQIFFGLMTQFGCTYASAKMSSLNVSTECPQPNLSCNKSKCVIK